MNFKWTKYENRFASPHLIYSSDDRRSITKPPKLFFFPNFFPPPTRGRFASFPTYVAGFAIVRDSLRVQTGVTKRTEFCNAEKWVRRKKWLIKSIGTVRWTWRGPFCGTSGRWSDPTRTQSVFFYYFAFAFESCTGPEIVHLVQMKTTLTQAMYEHVPPIKRMQQYLLFMLIRRATIAC